MRAVHSLLLVCLFLTACQPAPASQPPNENSAQPVATAASSPALPPATGSTAIPPLPAGALVLWVDIANGDDANTGESRAVALRTLDEAWARIPAGQPLTRAVQILLAAGDYPEDALPNYLELRYGTAEAPIYIQSADGPGTATLRGDLNIYDTHYLVLQDFNIIPDPAGDAFHCELCTHITLSGMVISGGEQQAHETIKINQSQYITIENSDISGAGDNAIDFVAVQYGRISGNRIHNAADWCIYVKGGSAYLTIESNEIFDCGTGGFVAGQGTGLEFMTAPWLQYEAYDILFINNLIHDTEGAGMGVNGGTNILLAYNTLTRVGLRSHVLEVVYGLRSCDGDAAACAERLALGGWGTTEIATEGEPIPNLNVYILNNIIYNPAGVQSQWQQFAIHGPRAASSGSNLPATVTSDTGLVIQGNVIWNGPVGHLLGIEDSDQGCQPANPTCNIAQLIAENAINTLEPQFTDPANGDYSPLPGGNLFGLALAPLPTFGWAALPGVPVGSASLAIPTDYNGDPRPAAGPPGAFTAP